MNFNQIAKQYRFLIEDISDQNESGFQVIVPRFPKSYIFADSIEEAHRIAPLLIAEELEALHEQGKAFPKPDRRKYSGKFVLRLQPELHERLVLLAEASGQSLNAYVSSLVEKQVA